MSEIKLTKRTVDSVRPRSKEYVVWDSQLIGFGLRVRPTGTKSFVAIYRAGNGRNAAQRKITIGPSGGTLTPDMARKAARAILGLAASGGDPALDRTQKRQQLTVAQLCDAYILEGCATKKQSTLATDRSRIERHIKPLLGRKRVDDVSRADIERFLRDVALGKTGCDVRTKPRGRAIVTGGKGSATRTVGLLGSIFSFAVVRGLRPSNPVRGVRRFRDKKNVRYLSPTQLATLGLAIQREALTSNPAAIAIVRMLAFTGARKSEITRLKWSEVDFLHSCLSLSDSKTGQKNIPLGPPALELLSSLANEMMTEWVFPARSGPGPFMGVEKVWNRIRETAGFPELRIHDLRHSFASMGIAGGSTLTVIGALLGHSDVKTTAQYAHLSADPIRTAADRISGAMATAMGGPSMNADIVQIKASRKRA
jgi:integrase